MTARSVWSPAHARALTVDPARVAPEPDPGFPIMSEAVWLWDTWPLTDLAGRPVSIGGHHVIFSLVAPRSVPFDDRHPVATIGWFSSPDGSAWEYRGVVFDEGTAMGTRQWAGSSVLVGDRVHLFYTASGTLGRPTADWLVEDVEQRMVLATAGVELTDGRVNFATGAFADSTVIASADGTRYQTVEQSRGAPIIYAFRDPYVFRDPADAAIYMLFSGNSARPAGGEPYTGNVGLARAVDGDLRHWELLDPVLSADGVNQQLERPHVVIEDGRYHLFFISHVETFAPGFTGPDGLYGFAAPTLTGPYQPLNGDALVLANAAGRRPSRYSDHVMPNWLVQGFIDTVHAGDHHHFGGTLAQTLRLQPHGSRVELVEQLGHGYIPAMVDVPRPAAASGPRAAP